MLDYLKKNNTSLTLEINPVSRGELYKFMERTQKTPGLKTKICGSHYVVCGDLTHNSNHLVQ